MLCGNGSFPQSLKDEDSAPTGSQKAFPDRSAGEHRTSRGGPFCQKNGLVPAVADGSVQKSDTSLEGRGRRSWTG